MSKKHAICSASGASRWLSCPGSVWASVQAKNQGLIEIKSSIYAEQGTKCHTVAEAMLLNYLENSNDEIPKCESEMFDAANFYVSKVVEEIKKFDSPPHVRIETPLEFDKSLAMFGTADCAMTGFINGQAVGVILDLKYGKTKVVAVGNPQLAFYACAMRKTSKKKLERIKVVIIQPRIKNPITEIEYSLSELMEWDDRLRVGAEKALNQFFGTAKREFIAGGHCKWCDGLPLCPVKNKMPDEGEGLEFNEEMLEN